MTIPRERLAALVEAASYGTILILGALTVIGVADVEAGHGAELVAGVGAATWVAHLFAEVLGSQVAHDRVVQPLHIKRAMADGSPILAAGVLPGLALLLGRVDVLTDATARIVAIVIAVLQLLGVGVVVSRSSAAVPRGARLRFVVAVVMAGVLVVLATVVLGH